MADNVNELKDAEQKSQVSSENDRNQWIWGGILILVGAALLTGNVTSLHFDNWWAIIVLALGLRSLWRGWQSRNATGHWGSQARSAIIWGGIITLAGLIFLFGWSWTTLWPLVIIIIGIGSLLPVGGNR
jgi:hypothetical protein